MILHKSFFLKLLRVLIDIFSCQTTLANIIANNTKRASAMRFVKLSATMSGVADVKEVIKIAKNEQSLFQCKTILFIDEIHRFNKMQQVCTQVYMII